ITFYGMFNTIDVPLMKLYSDLNDKLVTLQSTSNQINTSTITFDLKDYTSLLETSVIQNAAALQPLAAVSAVPLSNPPTFNSASMSVTTSASSAIHTVKNSPKVEA